MSRRDDQVSLRDMLNYAREAVALLGDASQEELARERIIQLALTRLVEIVGEAANRVSPETQQRYSEVPWALIIGMRNRLAHGYDVIDLDLLWYTVTVDLPPLIAVLNKIMHEEM